MDVTYGRHWILRQRKVGGKLRANHITWEIKEEWEAMLISEKESVKCKDYNRGWEGSRMCKGLTQKKDK